MRIFFAVPRSAWVDLNLRRSLEDMGHELIRFDFPGWPDEADPTWQQVGKPRTNQRLLDSFRTALGQRKIDLFYGYFYSSVVYPETIDLIRQSGVPTVNFSCNNVHQFDLVRDIAAHFDLCVVPEQAAQQDFLSVGARPVRIQLAANPRIYRPYPEPRVYDVTFVGQRYADRGEFLDHLWANGVAVRAWGAGWEPRKRLDVAHARAALALIEDERLDGIGRLVRQRLGKLPLARRLASSLAPLVPPATSAGASATSAGASATSAVGMSATSAAGASATSAAAARGGSGAATSAVGGSPSGATQPPPYGGPRLLQRDLIRVFSQSRLSLGFATAGASHLAEKRLTHLRLREFEAPMSGALYLTEDQPELAEYFRIGQEMLTYTDRDDLLDKARFYLAHQEQSERIRRAALERARQEHTWQHRFRDLFAVLGLREAA